MLHAAARRAYEQRIRDLQGEIDDAEAASDLVRAEKAATELNALVDQLTAALGLGRRSGSRGSSTERARSAVTHRVACEFTVSEGPRLVSQQLSRRCSRRKL